MNYSLINLVDILLKCIKKIGLIRQEKLFKKVLRSNNNRGLILKFVLQDKFYNGVIGGERKFEKEKENSFLYGRDV